MMDSVKNMLRAKWILSILIIGLLYACTEETSQDEGKTSSDNNDVVFSLLSSDQTGVDFENKIIESPQLSFAHYDYFYNGGGILSGDFNNDGLPDLFFTGNMTSNRLYINKGNLTFEDVSESAGIQNTQWSTGAACADVNGDGWMDIYVCNSGPYQEKDKVKNQLLVNNKDGTFSDQTDKYNVGNTGWSTQASFFDFDKDGDLDLFVLNHSKLLNLVTETFFKELGKLSKDEFARHSSAFYRNDGSTFTNITHETGMNNPGFGLGLITADLNHDGWIDVYVANDFFIPDFCYYNNKNGTFSEVSKLYQGHNSFYSMGMDAGDINNDGLIDFVIADMTPEDHVRNKELMASMDVSLFAILTKRLNFQYQYMFNTLQLNTGFGFFKEIALYAGVSKTDWSWTTILSDFNNDGYKDLMVTNGFYRDTKHNDWRNEMMERTLANGGRIPDDETLELLHKARQIPIPNQIFKNNGDLHFDRKTSSWGFEKPSFSHGGISVDLDLDGDLDVVINNLEMEAFVYENQLSQKNYIQIKPVSGPHNLPYYNAKVTIYYDDKIQYIECQHTRGYQSAMPSYAHFGLGGQSKVDKVEIEWLDGTVTRVENPQINKMHTIHKDKIRRDQKSEVPFDPYFFDITDRRSEVTYKHKENSFNDFKKEVLLPHKQSTLGPNIAVGDVNGDGLDDFFIGGSFKQAGILYNQKPDGSFTEIPDQPWILHSDSEDMGSLFFDADGDNDLDLYVVSGGGGDFTTSTSLLQDRLYINRGNGSFVDGSNRLPTITSSGSVVKATDYDKDGDLDLFVGGRTLPSKYPYPTDSYLLRNDGAHFTNVNYEVAPMLNKIGMVTDMEWLDIDNDKKADMVIVGEWMPIMVLRQGSKSFEDVSASAKTDMLKGWWYSIEKGDFDNDGDLDLIVGNIGKNTKFKASPEKPFEVYSDDFDDNGTNDIVLSYHYKDNLVPVRGKECSSQQMPFIAEKFPQYTQFANATMEDIYGRDKLENALHYEVTHFESIILVNNGNGSFDYKKLPNHAQLAPINGMIVRDFNRDGNLDVIIGGNAFNTEVETPRYDAGKGVFLRGRGDGTFNSELNIHKDGLFLSNNVKDLKLLRMGSTGIPVVLVANNDGPIQFFAYRK